MVTVVKNHAVSLEIRKLEALLRRLPPEHEKWHAVEREYGKKIGGYRGERSIEYDLKFLKKDYYYVLYDIRLSNQDGDHFQMDTLLLSPTYIVILETKNLSGAIQFKQDTHQMKQTKNGVDYYYRDPFIQVQRQRIQLERWLLHNKIPFIPIETQVVLSNSETKYEATSNHKFVFQNATVRENLPNRIAAFEQKHQEEILSIKHIKQIIRLILKQNAPSNPNIMNKFGLKKQDLILGVFCPNPDCPGISKLICLKSGWNCERCSHHYKDEHVNALKDYALLLGNHIANKEFREFTGVQSKFVASRMLKKMCLPQTGMKKSTVYQLSY